MSSALRLVTRDTLAGPSYRRLLRGVYQAADLGVTYDTMIKAARVAVGDGAVLVGPSAAWALGCRMAGPADPVHIAVTGGWVGGEDALVRHRAHLDETYVVGTALGPATAPARTALDLARGLGTRTLPPHRRVAWVDALLRATNLPAASARRPVGGSTGLHGITTARSVLLQARDGVDSPKETELRLLVVRLGFPEPLVQCRVVGGRGEVIARLDLGWPDHRLGLEYDGAVHREAVQHSRDLARHNRIRDAGWAVFQVDARGLAHPGPLIRQLSSRLPRG